MFFLCPAVCSEPCGEKTPCLLVVLHPPWAGRFLWAYSLFTLPQFLRWGTLLNAEEKKRIFRGGAGLSPALCARLDSQALCLPLPKAGKLRNPYPDTAQNGSTLGKFDTHDPQLDAKACLPTHTFPPCWNLRKSPKRPALPGAVNPGRCRSLAPTLSPAV